LPNSFGNTTAISLPIPFDEVSVAFIAVSPSLVVIGVSAILTSLQVEPKLIQVLVAVLEAIKRVVSDKAHVKNNEVISVFVQLFYVLCPENPGYVSLHIVEVVRFPMSIFLQISPPF